MKSLYLALPYSHPDPDVREIRHKHSVRLTARLLEQGWNVFSPITMTHEPAKLMGNSNNSTWWCLIDEYWQRQCTAFALAPLPGYRESRGVAREVAYAIRLHQEMFVVNLISAELRRWDFLTDTEPFLENMRLHGTKVDKTIGDIDPTSTIGGYVERRPADLENFPGKGF